MYIDICIYCIGIVRGTYPIIYKISIVRGTSFICLIHQAYLLVSCNRTRLLLTDINVAKR